MTVARRLAHHWQMLETLSDLSEIQTEQRKKLEQRVTALEKTWDVYHGETTRLNLASPSLSLPMDASITDSPSDAAEQESIPPESLASSRSDQRIIVGGRVGRALKSAQETDVPT